MSEPRRFYRFGPLERRGLLGPVRAGQAIVLGAGALIAVITLDRAPSPGGALMALSALALAAGFATAPVAGRTCEEWAPVLLAHLLRSVGGRRRFRSSRATAGARWSPRARSLACPPPEPPPQLAGTAIVELPDGARSIGVVAERGGRRLTAVLACRVVSFALLDPEAQERRLSHWGLVLGSVAGSAVRRLQWVERTAPAQGDDLVRWLHAGRDPEIPQRGAAIIESYLELISGTARITNEHEVLVAVQVDASRIRERGRRVEQVLLEQTERVARGLEAAEVVVLGALSCRQLARAVRTGFDPYCRAELAALEAADPEREALAPEAAWPSAAQEAWDHVRCDGACHATYWISGWPRTDVPAMFMDALLGPSGAVRSVAVSFEPIAPERSTREAEAAITRDRADSELRRRFGQSETARQRQAQEAALRREAELAAGHSEVRLAGFVTVSGRDEAELRAATAEVTEHAARARLELHRLYGQQAEAFTFTLPLARGLR
jgi:hypothetical protein